MLASYQPNDSDLYYGGQNLQTPLQNQNPNVPPWQVATGNGAAQAGSYLPDWRAGQPDQAGATDANGNPYPAAFGGAPPPTNTSGAAPQSSGSGLMDPALYQPWAGTPPVYKPPTLPKVPSFDDYYTPPPTPTFQQPVYKQPPPLTLDPFHVPTLQEAESQPGYQVGVDQGEKALQQSRASQGILRTGGTLKDILDYGRNAATQNYGNVFNQGMAAYNADTASKIGAYNSTYQTQYKDPNDAAALNAQTSFQDQIASGNQGLAQAQARFAPQLTGYQTDAANAQRQSELGYNSDWQKYLDSENVFYANQSGPFSKYLSLAQLGSQVQ